LRAKNKKKRERPSKNHKQIGTIPVDAGNHI